MHGLQRFQTRTSAFMNALLILITENRPAGPARPLELTALQEGRYLINQRTQLDTNV